MSKQTQEHIAQLIELVDQMVIESGVPAGFDAKQWVELWHETPVPALGDKRPREYVGTKTGLNLLKDLLRRSQSGAFS